MRMIPRLHETDLVKPMIVTAVLTTETESVEDVALVADAVEHSSVTETITPQDAAEDMLDGGGETVEPSECEPTMAEELSALEAPGEGDATVHVHLIEAAALTMMDDEPADSQLLQSLSLMKNLWMSPTMLHQPKPAKRQKLPIQ